MNSRLFPRLVRQASHKVSKVMHLAKCQIFTERIALSSFTKELHQIVNILLVRHPLKILPTIYPSAGLPSLLIRHFDNKV